MHNLVLPTTLPSMDSFAPKFCLCGNETVKAHDFWYCSTECARLDSLRSLVDSHGHYRENAYRAYVRASVRDLYPRRMMSADHLHLNPLNKCGFSKGQPRFQPPANPPQKNATTTRKDTRDQNMEGFPTLAQVTGKVPEREPFVSPGKDLQGRDDHPIALSRADPAHKLREHVIHHDTIALPGPDPTRSLKTAPRTKDGPKSVRTSVTALLSAVKSRKGRESESPERILGHPMNGFVPPTRKESLPSHRQQNFQSTNPALTSKALRRSVSCAGWDVTTNGDLDDEDPIFQIIEELREEFSGNFDPRSLFEMDGPC